MLVYFWGNFLAHDNGFYIALKSSSCLSQSQHLLLYKFCDIPSPFWKNLRIRSTLPESRVISIIFSSPGNCNHNWLACIFLLGTTHAQLALTCSGKNITLWPLLSMSIDIWLLIRIGNGVTHPVQLKSLAGNEAGFAHNRFESSENWSNSF